MSDEKTPGNGCDTADEREPALEPSEKKLELPFRRKICFAVGAAPYQLTGNAIGFFLQIFFLDVVQMEAFYASLIMLIGRVWDAFTDPTVGYLISRTKRTRCGKLKPWIILSMPFGITFYFLLWYTPSGTMSWAFSVFWYMFMYGFFQMSMSCYHVPLTSLTMFLGGSQSDRDSATAYRMGVEVLGTLAGSAIQGQIVGGYHAKTKHICGLMNNTKINSTYADTLHSMRRAYMVAAAVIVSLYFLSAVIVFFGVKEHVGPFNPLGRTKISFWTSLKTIMRHKPYVRLLSGFLFASLAFQLAQGNFALFCTHAAGQGDSFQHLVLILLIAASISIPFWQWFLLKFGKKTALFVGLSCFIPPLIVIAFLARYFSLFAVMVVISGCSLSVIYLLPWSMLPDAVDDFRIKNPDCMNIESMFFSFYVLFNKFCGGLSQGLSALSLHFAGYKPGACIQNPAVPITLTVLVCVLPIAFLLIGLLIFYTYPINEERRRQLKLQLKALGGKQNGILLEKAS
ncbi:sodium-dependent lysophosphatidylcholine symporter 1-like [Protopterus annectens]|uniref:sodium-dependent lysophosphatidylcholine symporter 1-like n=1 Tax=Protopterus annectens TaxID=7888 RepID=UPI001CFA519C|nr:sodium-dependent lysophosphatidylcholine symporter 1-like [Protopterus annectens]